LVNRGEARECLLNVAEQLFAQHGVDGVSLRSINAAAGVGPSILHYHFGNVETLLEAIIARRMDALMAQRRAMLQQLMAAGNASVREVIEAMVLPLATYAIEHSDSGVRYVRLIARLYADRHPILLDAFTKRLAEGQNLISLLLQRALPTLPKKELHGRLNIATHTMLHTLADLGEPPRYTAGSAAAPSKKVRWQGVAQLIDFMSAGMAAPLRDAD
jgi:AcrR family transcriptional regulator